MYHSTKLDSARKVMVGLLTLSAIYHFYLAFN